MTCDKQTFQTLTEAKTRAAGLNKAKTNMHLQPYLCPECGQYHLTTNNQRKKKRYETGKTKHVELPRPQKGVEHRPFMKKLSGQDPDKVVARKEGKPHTIGDILQSLMNAPKPTEEEAKIKNNTGI